MKAVLVYPQLNSPYFFPPMGVVSLATILKKSNVDVKIVDLTFSENFRDYILEIKEEKPDIVGISTMTLTINNSFEIAKISKEILPNCKVILGGPHATALPEETLRNRYIDMVVVGEGEETVVELVKTIEREGELSRVRGIYYKENKEIKKTPPRPFIEGLDNLSMVDRELLPTFKKYLKFPTSFPFFMPAAIMIVTRGCPFDCSFCQPMLRKLFGGEVRARSPELVCDEMESLIERYRVRSIYFTDDTFWADPEWAEGVCREIIKRGINKRIVWLAQTNIATLNKERIQLMKESGCIYLGFGVESGNLHILKKVLDKNHTPQKAREIFQISRELGMLTSANFIIGNPGETKEAVHDSVHLMEELSPDLKDIHYMTPTPGSALYDACLKKGLLQYQGWEDPDRYTPGLLKLKCLSRRELKGLYEEMEEAFLKHKSLFRMNSLWFKYLWNIVLVTKNPKVILKTFLRQLMNHNGFLNRLGEFLRTFFKKERVLRCPRYF